MKLLIITQKINKNDPILGFFHGWIREFSKHFESAIGICLEKGEYDLPANVRVLSLGKEEGNDQLPMINDPFYAKATKDKQFSLLRPPLRYELRRASNSQFFKKLKYTLRFWLYIWQERKNYDAVFVHMNQEYVLLGAKLWLLMGKKVYMWRNHHAGSFLTDVVAFFCTKVFCTSKYSYTAKYKKTVLMPVGIDTDLFERKSEIKREPKSILFLGRIAPIKRPDLLIDALIEIKKQNKNFTASIVGDPLPADRDYYDSLVSKVKENNLEDQIKFYSGIPNEKTVSVYNQHEIFVNLSTSGMYDKTIFEAMACECLVLASNRNLNGLIDEKFIFEEGNKEELVNKINVLLGYDSERMVDNSSLLRSVVMKNHGLRGLSEKLFSIMSS